MISSPEDESLVLGRTRVDRKMQPLVQHEEARGNSVDDHESRDQVDGVPAARGAEHAAQQEVAHEQVDETLRFAERWAHRTETQNREREFQGSQGGDPDEDELLR